MTTDGVRQDSRLGARVPMREPQRQHVADDRAVKRRPISAKYLLKRSAFDAGFRASLRSDPVPTAIAVRLPNNVRRPKVFEHDAYIAAAREQFSRPNICNTGN